MKYVRTDDGKRLRLAEPKELGLVPCTGEAHNNPWIDHCGLCVGWRWGAMMAYWFYAWVRT